MTAPRRALIIIDAQQEYFGGHLLIQHPPRDESIARIMDLVKTADDTDIPVVIVQHEYSSEAPVFAAGSATVQNHRLVQGIEGTAAKRIVKSYSSIFAATDLDMWLRDNDIDTITLVGFMTNNCVLASAAAAEPLGIAVEVLSDATGAVDLANEAGVVTAKQIHETLMTLLHSNWAAVADADTWSAAAAAGEPLGKSDLVTSAAQGRIAGLNSVR